MTGKPEAISMNCQFLVCRLPTGVNDRLGSL